MKRQLRACIALLSLLTLSADTVAQAADWSLEGDFQSADAAVQLSFELIGGGVGSAETFYGATYGHSGGTNGANDSISAGGFDPILSLYDVTGGGEVLRGENDDGWPGFPTDRDSRLSWSGVASQGGSIDTDPLPDGDYRMDLTAYQASYPGGSSSWAMDLAGPGGPVNLTGLTTTGGATIRSLKFGHDSSGYNAWFDLQQPSATITEELVVGMTTGLASLFVNAGTTLNTPGSTLLGGSAAGAATVSGPNAQWNANLIAIGGPAGGFGSLTIQDQGRLSSGPATVGRTVADGTVVVNGFTPGLGERARWDITGPLDVGSAGPGSGTVTIENAGVVTVSQGVNVFGSTNATSSLTVQTDGELNAGGQFDVGGYGTFELLGGAITAHSFTVDPNGTFIHEDGTLAVDGGAFDPGFFPSSSRFYTIDGAGAANLPVVRLIGGATASIPGRFTVAHNNRAHLEILDGSHLDLPYVSENVDSWLVIGQWNGSDGEVLVDGQDSQLTTSAGLDVGSRGNGILRITNGGSVSTSAIPPDDLVEWIGAAVGSTGVVEVHGVASNGTPSTWTTNGAIEVGVEGVGVLSIADGGRINALAGATIAQYATASESSATVTDSGSRWNVTGALYVGGSLSGAGGTGTLTVANDALVVADRIKVWQPGIVRLDAGTISTGSMEVEGQLTGNGAIILAAGEAVTNRGYVSPGLSPGVLTISGGSTGHGYVQEAAGILRIELGGPRPAEYDRLNVVAGSATLGGFLDVALIDPSGGGNPFTPSDGDLFEIVTAADGLGGTRFTNELLPTLPGGLAWNVLYGTHAVTLEVFLQSFLEGDFDEDGNVDGDDLRAWQTGFGTRNGAAHGDGDADGDGDVDGNDFFLWQRQFGSTGGGAAVGAVPEPAGAVLACFGGLIVLGVRRRAAACGPTVR